jgi:hypothetical protein
MILIMILVEEFDVQLIKEWVIPRDAPVIEVLGLLHLHRVLNASSTIILL